MDPVFDSARRVSRHDMIIRSTRHNLLDLCQRSCFLERNGEHFQMNDVWVPEPTRCIPAFQADVHQLEVFEMNDGSGSFLDWFFRKSRLKGTRYATIPVMDGR